MPLRRVLRDHLKRCLDLRADCDAVLADRAFERGGGTIHYAADFTEVFSYVYPLQAAERERFGLSEGEQRRVNLSDYVLDALFFRPGRPVVLLPPYQAELRGFGAELRTEQLEQFDRFHAAVAGHAERLRALPEFQELARVAGAADRERLEGLTDSLLALLEEHAPTLLTLGRGRSFMPIARLNRLLKTARFAALGDVLGGRLAVGDLEHELIARWQDRLHRQRPSAPEAANVMDAIAVAYLKEANRRLGDRGRVLLVTRSRTMHRVFDAELREGLWPGHAAPLLRRPQSFIERAACEAADPDAADEQLRHRRESLSAFILETQRTLETWPRPGQAAPSAPPWPGAPPRHHAGLAEDAAPAWDREDGPPAAGGGWPRQLSELVRQREALENLIMAEWLTRQPEAASSAAAGQPDVAAVLSLLQNDAELGDAISRRFLELAEEIDASHVLLAGDMARGDATARDQILRDVNLSPGRRRGGEGGDARSIVVLSSRVGTIPVTLQFYAHGLAALLQAGKPDDVALKEFLEDGAGARGGSSYERTLARGFVMATLGRWTLARFHCDLALRGADPGARGDDGVPRHEAHYFRSVCRRFSGQRGPDAYRASLDDLDEAVAIKRGARGDPGYEDPRYTNERAVVLHNWRAHALATGAPGAPDSFVEPVTLWKRSLARIRDDQTLKLLVLNNLCYHFVEYGQPAERHEAVRYYKNLARFVAELGRSEPELPCNVIDTLVWARWRLADVGDPERDPERLASLLRIALADPYIPGGMRATIQDHLAAVAGHDRHAPAAAAAGA
jgi:hypothetical protein